MCANSKGGERRMSPSHKGLPRLRRRDFLLFAGAVSAGLLAGSCAVAQDAKRRSKPNIIVILADDLGYGDICGYSCQGSATPNIDSIIENGIKFTDGYVSSPLCSPSRAGLMTGRYQQRFGHEFNAGSSKRCHEMGLGTRTSEILLPALLKDAGYATGMVGKWHLGSQPQFHPMARGFDEFFGFLHGSNLYMDPPRQPGVHVETIPHETIKEARTEINPILRGHDPVLEKEYLTDAFTRESLEFIDRHKEQPFFLYLSYNAPHTPLQVTDKYYDRFPEIEDEKHRIFAAMVSALDDGVGAVLRKLEATGLEKDTLVVFLSDNGCGTYTAACYNDPLLAGKLFHFEGGVRVPFCMQWTGTIEPGQTCEGMVSALDILPTAVELAGGRLPDDRPIDGVSLVPLLSGDKKFVPHETLYWRNGPNFAMRKKKWKLVGLGKERVLLFDLSKDTGENNDLSKKRPELVKELRGAYESWSSEMIEPSWETRLKIPMVLREWGIDVEGTYDFCI